jgi:hypothetical protein
MTDDSIAPAAAPDTLGEDWAAVKLLPSETGLPMAWITENDGYPHDVRVKAGGCGSWRSAASMAVRLFSREITPGSLAHADVALVARWIELNRGVIIAFWDGRIGSREAFSRRQLL